MVFVQVKQGAEKMLREHESSRNKNVINETEQMLADSKQKIIVLQVFLSDICMDVVLNNTNNISK